MFHSRYTACIHCGVIGAIMMLIISTQYKHALTNYGFSQGDIGKAMIVFADARSAARGVIGYNDTDMIATMKQIHDEKKQKFDDYWAIVANTCVTGTEKDLYEARRTHLFSSTGMQKPKRWRSALPRTMKTASKPSK